MPTHTYPPATWSRKLARAYGWDSIFLSTNVHAFLTKGLHLLPIDEAHILLAYGALPSTLVVYGDDAGALAEGLDLYPGIKCINDSFFAAADTYKGKLLTCFLDVGKDFTLEVYEQFLEVVLRLKPGGGASFYFVPSPTMPEFETAKERFDATRQRLEEGKRFSFGLSNKPRVNQLYTHEGHMAVDRASMLYEYGTLRMIERCFQMNKTACSHCLYLPTYRTLEGDPGLAVILSMDQKRPGESKSSFYRRRRETSMRGTEASNGRDVDEEFFAEMVLAYYSIIREHPDALRRVAQMFGIQPETLQGYLDATALKEVAT